MHTIFWLNTNLGIDVLQCTAFLCAALIAWFPGHWIVRRIFYGLTGIAVKQERNVTPDDRELRREEFKQEFNLELAALVGKLERVLYVLSIMTGIHPILSAWVVLKAFFSWIGPEKSTLDITERMKRFHVYIFGNGISLFVGILCGFLGKSLAMLFQYLLLKSA